MERSVYSLAFGVWALTKPKLQVGKIASKNIYFYDGGAEWWAP
jgi:hypothetical protein